MLIKASLSYTSLYKLILVKLIGHVKLSAPEPGGARGRSGALFWANKWGSTYNGLA